ncbi:MAG: conserved protein of unknown function [Nitrospira sp.]
MKLASTSQVWQGPLRLLVLITLLLVAIPLFALEVPPLTGRVVDSAHVLPTSDVDSLTASLKAHEEKTTNQVAVLIVPSLESEPLEEYAHRVATSWKLGQRGADNGVLLLIAVKERRLRIEVGYGLEGTLTDLRSAHIIRDEIVPRFKVGDMSGGVRAGTEAILKTIEGTYEAKGRSAARRGWGQETDALQLVFIGVVVGFLAGIVLSQGLRRTRALFGSLLAYLVAQSASMALGVAAAAVTAFLLWLVLWTNRGGWNRRTYDDWTWYSSRGGGWSGGSSDSGFSGGGGDFGGGGASGNW